MVDHPKKDTLYSEMKLLVMIQNKKMLIVTIHAS